MESILRAVRRGAEIGFRGAEIGFCGAEIGFCDVKRRGAEIG